MLVLQQFCYNNSTMIRTQLQLSEQQARALRELAARENRSMAELVREALDLLLSRRRVPTVSREELVRRSLAVAGKYRSSDGKLAADHDDAFVEAITDWPSSSTPRR